MTVLQDATDALSLVRQAETRLVAVVAALTPPVPPPPPPTSGSAGLPLLLRSY